jgi:hypothetical protein
MTDIVSRQPAHLRPPVIHTLTTHVTKEKHVFIYGLSNGSKRDQASKQGIASSVDFLWTLSLIYDDIIDQDSQRAGNTAAWVEYGSDIAMQSVFGGIETATDYIASMSGSESTRLVKTYTKMAIDSVGRQKNLVLGCLPELVVENYKERMGFHTALPIELLFPEPLELKQVASEAITTVNMAGQMLNDLKIWHLSMGGLGQDLVI